MEMDVNLAQRLLGAAATGRGVLLVVCRSPRLRLLLAGLGLLLLLLQVLLTPAPPRPAAPGPRWTWVCSHSRQACQKVRSNGTAASSEAACRLGCYPETFLWPLPVQVEIGSEYSTFDPATVTCLVQSPSALVEERLRSALAWQLELLTRSRPAAPPSSGLLQVALEVEQAVTVPGPDTQEEYSLDISQAGDQVKVYIKAETMFGSRHALETLFQLAQFDPLQGRYILSTRARIQDRPRYPHRGLMLDTARNFIPVPVIKTLIDSMSFSKLNVFHWHLTDSQSFPVVLESLPEFSEWGAYSAAETYSRAQVEEVVEHASSRGVRVLPEFDTPAHVGAGWEAVSPSHTLCVDREPWQDWCVEPPCGQLNPASPGLYDTLEQIYSDLLDMFPVQQFHMGGDEISLACWNSSQEVVRWLEERGRGREERDFMFVWSEFLREAVVRIQRAGLQQSRLVVWTSGLTKPEHIHHLDPAVFAVQIWTNSRDFSEPTIKTVAERGFKMIISNYDATYLDCGFGGWVTSGNNWCSPYKEWQAQHGNSLEQMLEQRDLTNLEQARANLLGGEVAMWTEQVAGKHVTDIM